MTTMTTLPRNLLRLSLTTLLFLSVHAETVQLASCPEEPDVVGKFYNNGETCVRDRIALTREVKPVECPHDYTYTSGWCRKRYKRKLKPTCPKDYQMFLGAKGECHSPCPPNYSKSYGQCTLRRASLSPKYMTCNATSPEGHEQHRNGAYCCSHELGNCPKPECKVGTGVPGKFYYADGVCTRQAESLPRVTLPKLKSRLGQPIDPNTHRPKQPPCPEGMTPIRQGCQEPCPAGFATLKGRCELRSCTFDTKTDVVVKCPEATYKLPQAIL